VDRSEAHRERSACARRWPVGLLTATIPAAFRGRARRDAAAFYLTQLAKGVLAGELGVVTGHGQTALVTSEYLVLKIEVKQRKRANHVEVKLRWPRRPSKTLPIF
jgi:amphi-Trp domain-containing protein